MKRYKFFLILVVLILTGYTLWLTLLDGKTIIGKEITEDILEINHSKEIEDVLIKFDSIYNSIIQESGAVGGAVVITYKGQVAMLKCFGKRKAGESSEINENTIFRLASVSKAVTGVLAGILASKNEINLDDKVIDIIPGFKLKYPESTNSITIRNLLSHSTGLVAHAYDIMVEDHVPLEQIIQRLNEVEIVSPPGLVYAYQNVMFSLFDPIIAAKTNKSFQQIIKKEIFEPFGMKDASIDFESFQKNENKAFPHQKLENGFSPILLNDRYYITAPAAGVNASISDMAQFLIAVSEKEVDLFSAEARKIVFSPQIETPLRRTYYRNWDNIESKHYAIGWRIINYKNHTIAHHGGFVSGYQSEIAVCEEDEIGIAILTNSPNSYFSSIVPIFFNIYFEHKNKIKTENYDLANAPLSKP